MLAVGVDALLLHPGIAFEESPTLQIDNYLVEIVSLSNRISSDYPLIRLLRSPSAPRKVGTFFA